MAIHGMLKHIMFVYRQGHSSLPPFSAFIVNFLNDFTHHHAPRSILESLTWWESILQNPSCAHSSAINLGIWVDMPTDWGIGIIFSQPLGGLETEAWMEV